MARYRDPESSGQHFVKAAPKKPAPTPRHSSLAEASQQEWNAKGMPSQTGFASPIAAGTALTQKINAYGGAGGGGVPDLSGLTGGGGGGSASRRRSTGYRYRSGGGGGGFGGGGGGGGGAAAAAALAQKQNAFNLVAQQLAAQQRAATGQIGAANSELVNALRGQTNPYANLKFSAAALPQALTDFIARQGGSNGSDALAAEVALRQTQNADALNAANTYGREMGANFGASQQSQLSEAAMAKAAALQDLGNQYGAYQYGLGQQATQEGLKPGAFVNDPKGQAYWVAPGTNFGGLKAPAKPGLPPPPSRNPNGTPIDWNAVYQQYLKRGGK